MSFTRLLLRNLVFHWRANLAILLGVVVGTAVLTGALLVGDSLRGSLRELTEKRLGWVDQVMVTQSFFREQLADELQGAAKRVEPALMVQSTAEVKGTSRRARKVMLMGVRDSIWQLAPGEVAVNQTLAKDLQAKSGDVVTLTLRRHDAVPSESLLGQKETLQNLEVIELRVAKILGDGESIADLKLAPDPQPARNAFVNLGELQKKLATQSRVNALLIQGANANLQQALPGNLTLDDFGLVLRTPKSRAKDLVTLVLKDPARPRRGTEPKWRNRLARAIVSEINLRPSPVPGAEQQQLERQIRKKHPYFSLESRQAILSASTAKAALAAANELGIRSAPTLVYLADSIRKLGDDGKEIPYSIVAALDPSQKPPLGPFLPEGMQQLKDGEIVLNDWCKSELGAAKGDKIRIEYFDPEHHADLKKKSAEFTLAGYVSLEGPRLDPDLTPEFPGVTDQAAMGAFRKRLEWYDPGRVGGKDEEYWEQYRTTPKAYVTLPAGQNLWASRFGELTSIRLARSEGDKRGLEEVASLFKQKLLEKLDPEQGGFIIRNVREASLNASKGGGFDFGTLMLGFSFFLIAAALLLVGLLFRLSLDRRASELGLLYASGFPRGTVQRLLLMEGTILAVAGGLVGIAAAVFYADVLVNFLRDRWPGDDTLFFLKRHVTLTSVGIGYGATLLMSVLTIWWSLRALAKLSPRSLIHGDAGEEKSLGAVVKPKRWRLRIGIGCVVIALALLPAGHFIKGHEAQAGTFFSGGMLLLVGGLTLLSAWMGSSKQMSVRGSGAWAVTKLGTRNAARHPTRSLLTAGLLASAAFLLIAVESFRRSVGKDFHSKESGSGGYPLLAESDLAIPDLRDPKRIQELQGILQNQYQKPGVPAKEAETKAQADVALLKETEIQYFRVRRGDDTSCLNLFQPQQPTIMAVPESLIERGGFRFASDHPEAPNQWTLLNLGGQDDVIPVIGEKNSVQWMLKAGVGDVLEVENGAGEKRKARVAALLFDSIFQSSLLVSESSFRKLFPDQRGYQFLLIRPPQGKEEQVKALLENALGKQGLEVTSTEERLQQYLAVENTYLSTFQVLGGFGLLLGTLGLAIVLLRSTWERRGELALLRALGFRRGVLGWLVLSENGFLLLLGLALGALTAAISVTPHVLSSGTQVSWLSLFGTLALVMIVGVATALLAVASAVRAKLIPALRKE